MNVAGVLQEIVERLRRADIDSPRLTGELLVAHALRCERVALFRCADDTVSPEQLKSLDQLLSRRLAHEPLQHILGVTEFWSLPIRCDRRALIPRPETELLVEVALGLLKDKTQTPAIADIATGTGCIAIALAKELPAARIYATDVSHDALELARENLAANNLADRVRLCEGALFAPLLLQGLIAQFDLILSNPPYIPTHELPGLQLEVRDYDPTIALDGGEDGLGIIRGLLNEAPALLRANGYLAFEIGAGQAEVVSQIIKENDAWRAPQTYRDHCGIERVIAIQKNSDWYRQENS